MPLRRRRKRVPALGSLFHSRSRLLRCRRTETYNLKSQCFRVLISDVGRLTDPSENLPFNYRIFGLRNINTAEEEAAETGVAGSNYKCVMKAPAIIFGMAAGLGGGLRLLEILCLPRRIYESLKGNVDVSGWEKKARITNSFARIQKTRNQVQSVDRMIHGAASGKCLREAARRCNPPPPHTHTPSEGLKVT